MGKTSKYRIKYLHFCKETCNINSRLFIKNVEVIKHEHTRI